MVVNDRNYNGPHGSETGIKVGCCHWTASCGNVLQAVPKSASTHPVI